MLGVIKYRVEPEQAEVVYSIAGVFSKLAILFGDFASYKHNYAGAAVVLSIISLVVFVIIAFSFGSTRGFFGGLSKRT